MNPQDPFYKDIDSLPPYIDYQIASIIIQRILSPLRKDVLRILQTTFNTHSPKDWFATFLASFILLQNYEMQVLFQRQFAERRRARVRRQSISQNSPPHVLTFPNCRCNTWTCRSCGPPTRAPKPSWRTSTTATRASGSSRRASTGPPRACAGWRAWTRSRAPSWRSAGMWWCRRVSLLSPLAPRWQCNTGWGPSSDQIAAPTFQRINSTHVYHDKWWYTSQLFDPDWTPRDTLEHAPPAEPFVVT